MTLVDLDKEIRQLYEQPKYAITPLRSIAKNQYNELPKPLKDIVQIEKFEQISKRTYIVDKRTFTPFDFNKLQFEKTKEKVKTDKKLEDEKTRIYEAKVHEVSSLPIGIGYEKYMKLKEGIDMKYKNMLT